MNYDLFKLQDIERTGIVIRDIEEYNGDDWYAVCRFLRKAERRLAKKYDDINFGDEPVTLIYTGEQVENGESVSKKTMKVYYHPLAGFVSPDKEEVQRAINHELYERIK